MFPNRTRATLVPHGVAPHSSRAARRSPLSRAHRAIAPNQPFAYAFSPSDPVIRPPFCTKRASRRGSEMAPGARANCASEPEFSSLLSTRPGAWRGGNPRRLAGAARTRRQSPTTRWGCSDAKAIPDDSLGAARAQRQFSTPDPPLDPPRRWDWIPWIHPGSTPGRTRAADLTVISRAL